MGNESQNEEVSNLIRLMREQTIFNVLDLNEERLEGFVEHMLTNENACVYTYGSPAVGLFIGEVYSHFFTKDLMAVDQVIYVHPDHRGKGIAKILLEKYIAWAKSKGAKLTLCGSSSKEVGVEKLFQSIGMVKLGENYGLW